MKKFLFLAVLVMLSAPFAVAATYNVDTAESNVKWIGTKITGQHDGHIELASGTILFEGDVFKGGEAVIDMTTLTVADIEDPEKNQKLEGHLKNADFFEVDSFKTASIKVTEVTSLGDNQYDVSADITIKGTTEPIQFPATVKKDNGMITAEAKLTIDRTKFDVRYGSGKFFQNLGDRLIHDEFTLDVSVVAQA